MHCHFLVISSLWIFGKHTYRFEIIKPYEVGSSNHYLRFEGLPKTPYLIPIGVTDEILQKISKNHIIHKFCAEKKENLSSLEKHFEANTHRKSDVTIDPGDKDPSYTECHKNLNQYDLADTIIHMSAISKRVLSPCTLKIIIQDISYRHARVFGPQKAHSHNSRAKISLLWDKFIPFHDLLDEKDPLMTMENKKYLIHLVHIAGFLKLVTHLPTEIFYKITPALGNPPENEIYEFLENPWKFKIISPNKVEVAQYGRWR